MTKKQTSILNAALALFATEGYDATSTRKIAQTAGVSEGLIFRHFQNKEGLLDAVLMKGQERTAAYFAQLEGMEDPHEILRTIIKMPFQVDESEHPFWRLIYTLKWQQRKYNSISFEFMLEKATWAFDQLKYDDPRAEAEVLEMLLDGAATVLLLKDNAYDKEKVLKSIQHKYKL